MNESIQDFKLHSNSVKPGTEMPEKFIFNGMGCHGSNISPALDWSGEPEETQSFAITVVDPDSSMQGGWRHWTLMNIPKEIHSLEEGASGKGVLPDGSFEVENDFDNLHYGGPCPPKGSNHRYVFTIYALDTKDLNLNSESDRVDVETILKNHCVAKTSFTVRYQQH